MVCQRLELNNWHSLLFKADSMNMGKGSVITTKTILLINSEPNAREVMQACLSDVGNWNVLTAGSLLEGLRQALLHPPDAIILELPNTGMDEFRVLEKLRAQPITQKIPVVLLRARAKWLDSQLLQRYQVAGVITNSLDPAILSERVAQLLDWDSQVD
jgi:CheY-like chemotaxis protein